MPRGPTPARSLHARLRKGSANTQRGTKRFVEELVARLRRAGATGHITMRFDSGYWSYDTIKVLGRLGVSFTKAVPTGVKAIAACIGEIDESNWVAIGYPDGGEAMVTETMYKGRRLVVRRTRLRGAQATLWPNWRHFAFMTVDVRVIPQSNVQVIHHSAPAFLSTPSHLLAPVDVSR